MKIAIVAGFFDPVKKALDHHYSEQLQNGSLIWIRQAGQNREANLKEFAGRFNDRMKRDAPESVLVLLAVLKTCESWLENAVQGIIRRGIGGGTTKYEVVIWKNAGDRDWVLEQVKRFELPVTVEVETPTIRAKVPQGKILCISMSGKTSVLDSLRRAGFSADAIHECFEEERIKGSKNSGLMELLAARSNHHTHLIYAWDGLRTLKPEVKGKFAKCYEASSAAKVTELLKRWILEGV